MGMGASYSTAVTLANGLGYFYHDKPSQDDFEEWKRDYIQRLEEERKNDPKTFIGWALKGLK